MSHFKAIKCTKFDSHRLSVRPYVRLCLRWSFTLKPRFRQVRNNNQHAANSPIRTGPSKRRSQQTVDSQKKKTFSTPTFLTPRCVLPIKTLTTVDRVYTNTPYNLSIGHRVFTAWAASSNCRQQFLAVQACA